MKRFCIVLLIAIFAAGTAFAQGKEKGGRDKRPDPVTIEGTLTLEKGIISLTSGENVYFIPRLSRLAGFIDGLKEGAKVTVQGYVFKDFMQPEKITLNGKSYDFPKSGMKRMGGDFKHGSNRFNHGNKMQGFCGCSRQGPGKNKDFGFNRGDDRGQKHRPDGRPEGRSDSRGEKQPGKNIRPMDKNL